MIPKKMLHPPRGVFFRLLGGCSNNLFRSRNPQAPQSFFTPPQSLNPRYNPASDLAALSKRSFSRNQALTFCEQSSTDSVEFCMQVRSTHLQKKVLRISVLHVGGHREQRLGHPPATRRLQTGAARAQSPVELLNYIEP